MLKVSAAALFVGTFLTLFALAPSTDRTDARVFLGVGPLFLTPVVQPSGKPHARSQ